MTSTSIYDCITESVVSKFKPTRLYIKQHKLTGLLYFGKTTKTGKAFDKYLGSGIHWKRHLKKHGKEVVTLWISETYTIDKIKDLVDFALFFSEEHDIVKSEKWGNAIIENGLDGTGVYGKRTPEQVEKNRQVHIGQYQSPERNAKASKALTGKIKSETHLANISKALTGNKLVGSQLENIRKARQKLITCPHCGKTGGAGGFRAQHMDYCRKNDTSSRKYHAKKVPV